MPFIPDDVGLQISPKPSRVRSHGLLSSIEPVQLSDPHWQAGLEWESDCSVEAGSTLAPCPEALGQKSTDGGLIFCTAEPFTVYGSYKCSTGGRPASESLIIAQARLNRNKERAVEKIFWTGITPVGTVSPSLQSGNLSCEIVPVDITPEEGPLDPTGAIAALESSIAECIPGGIGVIHVNFGFLPYLAKNYLLYEKNNRFYTPSGQLIIAGAGYPGSGPENIPALAGETWIFATGSVAVYQSDVFLTPSNVDQAVDRSLNNVTFFAEQTYSVIWECCIFAIRAQLC
jgi:hypothetical protein